MRRLWLVAVVGLLGCPGENRPPADRCTGVRCTGSDLCNSATGLCEPQDAGQPSRDAGPEDAGHDDAGVVPLDAGLDAGGPDAGDVDAGAADAGREPEDAGVDAGVVDAGCHDDTDCFGVQHCELDGRCVECTSDLHCPAGVCDRRSDTCVGCVANADCANPTPICDQQQCLPCESTAACGAGRTCSPFSFTCESLNETCATARPILNGGTGLSSFLADPSQALDDVTLGCSAAGPELVYVFTTTTPQRLTATAVPEPGSQARPVLALRSDCAGADVRCDAPSTGSAALNTTLAPGTWYLFVESAHGTPGQVRVTLTLQDPSTVPPNDLCADAAALAVDGVTVNGAVLTGSTDLAGNDGAPTCSATASSSGKDLAWRLTLAAQSDLSVTARPLPGSTLHPVVSIRTDCADAGLELACQTSTAASSLTAALTAQPAGDYVVQLDSADGTSGDFQLEVTAIPVLSNDGCASPELLVFDAGVATALGDTTWATNGTLSGDSAPGCSDSARVSGHDLVYRLTLTQPQDVHLLLTPTGNGTYEPVLSVRAAPCVDGSRSNERACTSPVQHAPAEATLRNQPAGELFVWVDSAEDTSGPFQLEARLEPPTPPPANDGCASPEVLELTSGVASFSGSTAQAANDNAPGDLSPTCNVTAKQTGKDVVYTFTLAQPQDVQISVLPLSGSGFFPTVYVRRSACGSQLLSDELFCGTSLTGVQTTLTRLPAGTYFLFVDGAGGTSGDFTGTVTVTAPTPAPPNDDCAGAQALSFVNDVATVTGSLVAASNSNTPSDNAPACGSSFLPRRYGRDLVYSYTLTATRDVELRLLPTGDYQPAIYVRSPGACSSFSAGSELACVATDHVDALHVVLTNQVAGTYFVFVDSNGYAPGDFTLTVQRSAPTPAPANDSCFAPVALTAGTPQPGNTTPAHDSYDATTYATACRGLLYSGRDQVYSWVATATGTASVVVSPAPEFNPALLLLGGSCNPSQCQRGVDAVGPGVPESFSFPVTAGQTYFFVVDSRDRELPGAFGAFELTVTAP